MATCLVELTRGSRCGTISAHQASTPLKEPREVSMFSALTNLFRPIMRLGLVSQIALGIVAGVLLVVVSPDAASSVALLGQLFVKALKAVAPVLVFVLVAAAIAGHTQGQPTHIRGVLLLYILGTLAAAVVAVVASFLVPTQLSLDLTGVSGNPPSNIGEILHNLVLSAVSNPVRALMESNFIAILVWAVGFGFMLRTASDTTQQGLQDLSDAISGIVRGSGYESTHCFLADSQQSLSVGVLVLAGQCDYGLFYAQFCS